MKSPSKRSPSKQRARRRYRERMQQNGGTFDRLSWWVLCAKCDFCCVCCGREAKLTIDHITPLAQGGRHEVANAQPLCAECNSFKGNRLVDYRSLRNV